MGFQLSLESEAPGPAAKGGAFEVEDEELSSVEAVVDEVEGLERSGREVLRSRVASVVILGLLRSDNV